MARLAVMEKLSDSARILYSCVSCGKSHKKQADLINAAKHPWTICYNKDQATFVLKPSKTSTTDNNFIPIKYLSSKQVERFGTSECSNGKESYLCIRCGEWLNGLCFKHPLVFVKERIPKKPRYQVIDTLPPFLCLGKSTIPNAGTGVYTLLYLPAGLAFGPYAGKHSNNGSDVCSKYSWTVGSLEGLPSWVDAESLTHSNWLRYVNCPRSLVEQNMVGLLFHGQIYYYTFRPIEAGSELMVWYGKEYGMSLRVPNADEANGPVAPENYDLYDEQGRWIGKPVETYGAEDDQEALQDAQLAPNSDK